MGVARASVWLVWGEWSRAERARWASPAERVERRVGLRGGVERGGRGHGMRPRGRGLGDVIGSAPLLTVLHYLIQIEGFNGIVLKVGF